MAQRGVGRRLTFQEVAHLQPGDRLLEVDDSLWGGRCLLVVESIPQLTTASDGGRRLTFRGILEANGRVVDYGLSEHHYAHGPRLYRPEPVFEQAASSLPLIDPAYTRPGLGELDILSDLDSVFLLGEFVAGLNAQGTLVHVGFLADVTLSPRTGCWAFFATDHLECIPIGNWHQPKRQLYQVIRAQAKWSIAR